MNTMLTNEIVLNRFSPLPNLKLRAAMIHNFFVSTNPLKIG